MRTVLVNSVLLSSVALMAASGLGAQETRFSPSLRAGQTLSVATIDGNVTVSRGDGRTAEIIATKRVRRGDGSRVKAVMEETSNGVRVCTVYLQRNEPDRDTCNSDRNWRDRNDDRGRDRNRDRDRDTRDRDRDSNDNWRDNNDVEISYVVRLPAGVELNVATVDGDVDVRGMDAATRITTVDGDIIYDGVAPLRLNTVDGNIRASISGEVDSDISMQTVDGSIDVTLPRDASMQVRGSTIDGSFQSDFPLTVRDKWGPRSINGTIGRGGDRVLRLGSVDGDITLRRR